MSKFKEPAKITCKEAQLLMVPLWANMRGIADEEEDAFNAHILVCPACAEEYEETKELMPLVKANWGPISNETQKLLENAGYEVKNNKQVSLPTHKMTVEEGWKDLCRRCPGLAKNTNKSENFLLLRRIGAVAACLVIGIFTWMIFSNHSKSHPLSQTSSFQQVASVPERSVKVELVGPSGNMAISADQKIIADNEFKTLLINDKHRMVLNMGTSLSIGSLTVNSNLGCLVKLNSGEIYTHVEHDGNPFIVQTANGKATITGTTFNIKAEINNTTLTVTEGSVLLTSKEGKVSVGAGQLSQIVNQSAPTKPAVCDVGNLTAWAIGYKPESTLVQTESAKDCSWQPPLSTLRPEPIELDKTDYKSWVEEKRQWFSKNFPWIFELKNALTKEGIEADYPELLIKTGDVWQFICLDGIRMPAKFSMTDFDSLLRAASSYGFDKEWLLKNVPTAKVALGQKSLLQNTLIGMKAFDQWLKYAESKREVAYGFYSADASKYLAETRSLIWFAVKYDKFNLTNTQQTKILDLLQQEIAAACNCQNEVLYSGDEIKKSFCGEDLCKITDAKIVEYIEIMKDVEKQINRYEIIK